MERKKISSGVKWESEVGYSRAVQVGNIIEIAGRVASDENDARYLNDVYQQTVFILEKIKQTLQSLDSSLEDVVRTRIFVVNIDDWEEIGRAHGAFFGSIRPVTTMVEVSRLISPDYLVEIEATAIVSE